ncbi:MAG: serine/threonine-protein kinase [Halobacteriota archaeon]|nr:serine/threonine-protein kinase [Halobacteriota archaeon]
MEIREVIKIKVEKIIDRTEQIVLFGLYNKNILLKLYTVGCIIWAIIMASAWLIEASVTSEGFSVIEDFILDLIIYLTFAILPFIPIYYLENKSSESVKTIITPITMKKIDRAELIVLFGLYSKNVLIRLYTVGCFIWVLFMLAVAFTPPIELGVTLVLLIFAILPFIPIYYLENKSSEPSIASATPASPTEIPAPSVFKPPEESEPKTPSDFPQQPTTLSTFPLELQPDYTYVEYVGKGGFGRVFKAKRKSDGKVVAVKIPLSLDKSTGDSFLKEIKAWDELKHSNIVELYDRGILPIPYFEMEYMEHGGLEEVNKPLGMDKAKQIIVGIAEGLKCAHEKGIIHRDLKPHNVLMTKDMVPKITDWGLSKVLAESRTSSVVGFSPIYAAPEQISPKDFGKTDKRTDIWQVGVIFYELVCGTLPFLDESVVGICKAIASDEPNPPSKLNPKAREFDEVILKCLAKRKEDRFRDIHEFLEWLEIATRKVTHIEELKKSLSEQKEILKGSITTKEIEKNKRMVVEILGELAVVYAESKNNIKLLNTLQDLKHYTEENAKELERAIEQLEVIFKNRSELSDLFVDGIKSLVHNIRREY